MPAANDVDRLHHTLRALAGIVLLALAGSPAARYCYRARERPGISMPGNSTV